MRKRKMNNKGISLIVLIITIIVMIILGGAIILSLNNTNIFDKAKQAVNATNLQQVKQMASVAWSEAYMEGARTKLQFKEAVQKSLKDIDTTKYNIKVTTSGVTVKAAGPWSQDGTTVTNGEDTLYVGDYIDYVATGSDYTGTWQVLGVEGGELLIVSSEDVTELELGSNTSLVEAQSDFVTGADQLDAACSQYGNGAKASGVRSITGEDIDRVAKYYPSTFTGESLGVTALSDYGNEVTFYWNGTDYPTYKSAKENGKLGEADKCVYEVFVWYDEESKIWRQAANPGDSITAETQIVDSKDSTKIAKIKNNFCIYEGAAKFGATSAAYKMLVGEGETNYEYWLASPCSLVGPNFGSFGLRAVVDGFVGGDGLVNSDDDCVAISHGVRAVVSLESNIQLGEGANANSWIITNKNS